MANISLPPFDGEHVFRITKFEDAIIEGTRILHLEMGAKSPCGQVRSLTPIQHLQRTTSISNEHLQRR